MVTGLAVSKVGMWEELGTTQREGLGTGLGVRGIEISSTELSENDSGRRAELGMRRRGLGTGLGVRGVVTSTRELTEDESESLSSAFSGTFEVKGAKSDFSGSIKVESLSFESFPTTMIAPFRPGWLNFFFFGDLSAKYIYDVYECSEVLRKPSLCLLMHTIVHINNYI